MFKTKEGPEILLIDEERQRNELRIEPFGRGV